MVLSQIFIFILFKVVSLKVPEGKIIYSSYDKGILSSTERTEMSLLRLAHIKRKILTLRSMYLMQPQADIDEIGLETMIQMLLYLLFQWLALPIDELWITYGSGKNVHHTERHRKHQKRNMPHLQSHWTTDHHRSQQADHQFLRRHF